MASDTKLIAPRTEPDGLSKAERRALRLCAQYKREGAPEGTFEVYEIEQSSFCFTAIQFKKLQKRYAKYFPDRLIHITHRAGKFVVCSLPNPRRNALRFWLQRAGAEARRRDRIAKIKGHHQRAHYRVLWEIQEGKCYFSGAPLGHRFEDRAFTVDHLDPVAVRPWPFGGVPGTNWPINLALVTKRVNSMKCSDDEDTFLWRLKHEPWRYDPPFKPRPEKERKRIDKLRRLRFAEYMAQHCSEWPDI